ncbi:MAG: bifunctional (p)ppGpp synthetase/guanosine-3',5'-bis(diphosphate) 3'-pyrophosphohydrolase, partial [bacterium]
MKKFPLEDLLNRVTAYKPDVDTALITKAYEFAAKVHKDQKRLSGDPYITHPLAIAEILTTIEVDETTICGGLLHDTIEDGGVTKAEINKEFGPVIADLVEGVTKLGMLSFESVQERQAANFRKMFMAMGEDIRVIIIKLADRLHNMRTLKYLPARRQKEVAKETLDILAPLAHRLGIWNIKWELEDLAFRYLEPQEFESMKSRVSEKREERERYIKSFIKEVESILDKFKIKGEIQGRPKHFYSIYRKIKDKNLTFEEVYDILAVRIIVDTVRDCYAVLGALHAQWKPIPGRFRDFIAMPKPNGYQTLHTTVIGPEGRPVEIQIRTLEMHRIAEHGIAAHWTYKEKDTDKDFDKKLSWLRGILDQQADLKNAQDFMDILKVDLFVDEVFVFTPKGDVHSLALGSTPVDFAYHIHTEVGHRCIGAKISGRIVPLEYKLKTGDIVEIITAKSGNPNMGWLNFVKTGGAKTKIKQYFKKQKREESLEHGKKELEKEFRIAGLDIEKLVYDGTISKLFKIFNVGKEEDLFIQVGY